MLQHDNKDILNCYYAHSEEKDGLQVDSLDLQAQQMLHNLFPTTQASAT